MEYRNNPQLQLAYDFVQFTGRNIFLTGKAGTGKTTFLHYLKQHSPKRMVVVAPTGVAAINAAGVTIHSFFQLSFGPQLPEGSTTGFKNHEKQFKVKRFNRDKINIIKSMDLLVIDEISMVRADLLDGIDSTLRRFRTGNLPFGGVQLLMIGDLQQLAPVAKDDEWRVLKHYYDTAFFFSSKALQQTHYITIELQYVFRQKDQHFVELLNKVRDNEMDKKVVEKLNMRYNPKFNADESGYIILTTHNYKAKQINDSKLSHLLGKPHTFNAEVNGSFSEYSFPTDSELQLKKGAQVMFVKNDPDAAKRFYNGKIGTIIEITKNVLKVKCDDDDEPINVVPVEWQKMKYVLDEGTKEIKESVEGTFTQLPLKLAWAITIHKSQGLTFEKAVIDAQEAFTHGQVYVALSRCKSLEGLVLSSRIDEQSVKYDKTVESFTKYYEENQPDSAELKAAKNAYQQQLLTELFDFDIFQKNIYYFIKLLKENSGSLQGNLVGDLIEINKNVKKEIADVNNRFHPQLLDMLSQNTDVEKDKVLQERVKKASAYFANKVDTLITNKLIDVTIETDNKAVRKSVKQSVNKLLHEAVFKTACLRACQNGFVVKEYLTSRAKASINDSVAKPIRRKSATQAGIDIEHTELYQRLRAWRDAKADELEWEVYMILQLKTIRELSVKLPITPQALKSIKGLGKRKLEMFGEDLIEIVTDYCDEKEVEPPEYVEPEIKPKTLKSNTKQVSFELWKKGKTVEEIAKERNYAESTIEGHLSHFVGTGEIPVNEFVNQGKVKLISGFFKNHKTRLLSEAKAALGEEVTYSELHFVLHYLKFKGLIAE